MGYLKRNERRNGTKIHMSEPKKTIENAAKERKAYLEKYEKKKEQMKKDLSFMRKDWFGFMKQLIGGSSDKKKKQMILATEFVLDLLQSEKSVKNDDVKKDLSFMRKDSVWWKQRTKQR